MVSNYVFRRMKDDCFSASHFFLLKRTEKREDKILTTESVEMLIICKLQLVYYTLCKWIC